MTGWSIQPRPRLRLVVSTYAGSLVMIQTLALVQSCTFSTPWSEDIAKGHDDQVVELSAEAIEHAKRGDTEAFRHKAQQALQAAEMAHQQHPERYLEQAITRLKMGMEYGKHEQADKGQKQVSKARQQILTRTADANPNDRQLGTIMIGRDGVEDIQRKLGNALCRVTSASHTTVSYLYNVAERAYLRLEMTDTVQAITLSASPPLVEGCYTPVQHPFPVQTGKGLQLGATTDDVIHLYGMPSLTFREGPLQRFQYEAILDHPYEWDVLFRNGRLIEWTVAVYE